MGESRGRVVGGQEGRGEEGKEKEGKGKEGRGKEGKVIRPLIVTLHGI